VTIQINDAWCKGCTICVEFCPKDVLVMNRLDKVEVKALEACTKCLRCEQLCPDFAIVVFGSLGSPRDRLNSRQEGRSAARKAAGALPAASGNGGGVSTQMKSRLVKLLQGNEACAEAAIAAGCRFFAGYPISPSSEIAEHMSVRMPQVGGRFIQMEDEIAAMGAILGAAMTGAKVMTATSGPGYSLKQESIGYAIMAEIPCVIVDVMRGGPSTGLPTSPAQSDVMQARWGTHGDHPAVALAPASVREVYDETIRAFNIAERFRMPVTLLVDEIIAHMRERVDIPDKKEITVWDRPRPTVPPEQYLPFGETPTGLPPMANFGEGYRYHVTGLYHDPRPAQGQPGCGG
jgi:TPP-dependent indolepyruvate ferredoxin oxidoreductase alpha subunit